MWLSLFGHSHSSNVLQNTGSGALARWSASVGPHLSSCYQVLLGFVCVFVGEGYCFAVLLEFCFSKVFITHLFLYPCKPGQEGGKKGQS